MKWVLLVLLLAQAKLTLAIHPSVSYRWMHRGAGTPFVDCIYGEARGDSVAILLAVDPLGPGLCPRIPVGFLGVATGLRTPEEPCAWSDEERALFASSTETWWIKWCGGDLWQTGGGRFTVIRRNPPPLKITD